MSPYLISLNVSVFDAKRLIGRKFDDAEVQADVRHFPFTVFNKTGKPYIRVQYRGEKKEFVSERLLDSLIRGPDSLLFIVA